MMLILLQASPIVDPRMAIREHFQRQVGNPNTWIGIILVLAGILVFLVMLHFLLYYEKRLESPKVERNPHRLFNELLSGLSLGKVQQQLLYRMSHDLRLQFPTQMLLSPQMFSQISQRWLTSRKANSKGLSAEFVTIGKILFSESNHDGTQVPVV